MSSILVPVLVGALIGYLDHWIVVKMIFWPRQEYRVFGIRVPLTPGVFAKRRKEFAVAVAELIESRFVNGHDLYSTVMSAFDDGSIQEVNKRHPFLGLALKFYFANKTEKQFAEDCKRLADEVRESKKVSSLVRTSIDAMPLETVEEMVDAVIASELRVVIWLGAPLGAFIGLMQAVFGG
jgi:uncharacterized membrane protein YheB (UPF0754 family)